LTVGIPTRTVQGVAGDAAAPTGGQQPGWEAIMPMTNEAIYDVDGECFTPGDLINLACEVDEDFALSPLKSTSEAAAILRGAGARVNDIRK
jgi:hypothetical protein